MIRPNDPAFPIALGLQGRDGVTRKMDVNDGISIRAYLAGQALTGLLANAVIAQHMGALEKTGEISDSAETLAARALECADALINELNR